MDDHTIHLIPNPDHTIRMALMRSRPGSVEYFTMDPRVSIAEYMRRIQAEIRDSQDANRKYVESRVIEKPALPEKGTNQ